jgi:ABC-type branched-subunit amino acid transport system ATPase component
LQAEEKVLAQRASLKADPHDWGAERIQEVGDFVDLTRELSLHANLATTVHNAKRARPKRHIQTNEVFHFLSPYSHSNAEILSGARP